MSYWKIVIPAATKNYVPNPSFETDLTSWTNYGTGTAAGSRSRVTTNARYGNYCYQITKSSGAGNYGAYIDAADLSEFGAGETIYGSAFLKVPAGMTVYVEIQTSGAGGGTSTLAVVGPAEGRYSVMRYSAQDVTVVDLFVYTTTNGTFQFDGAQIEKDYDTDYCDGDQAGCYWDGTYHGSASHRLATSRAGGRAVDFDSYGYYVKQIQGIGVPPHSHIIDPLPLQDGSLYRRTQINQRTFTLQGTLIGTTRADLHDKRKTLFDLLKLDNAGQPGAFELRYSGSGDTLRLKAIYQDGMGFGSLDGFSEDIGLRFVSPEPFWAADAQQLAALTLSQSVTNADSILMRERGLWKALGTGVDDGTVQNIVVAPNGDIYVCGTFTGMGGVANTSRIAVYRNGVWVPLATGLNDACYAMVRAPDGIIYVGGEFLNAGGDANADRLAQWSGSAFTNIGGAADGRVRALAIGLDGTLIAGGDFTNLGGVVVSYISYFSSPSWQDFTATSTNGPVYAIAVAPNGDIYIGGNFDTVNSITVNNLARWDGSAWHACAAGVTGWVNALAFGPDGMLYIGGSFTDAGNNICRWTGSALETLGIGVSDVVTHLNWVDDLLFVSGTFLTAGGLTLPDWSALWNGSSWSHLDFDLPGSSFINAARQRQTDEWLIGYGATGTATTSVINTLTNNGSRRSYPVMTIHRSGGTSLKMYWLENLETGARIYLNYSLLDGETLTLDFRPNARDVHSSFFGLVWDAVLRGSTFADFYLLPGANRIVAFGLSAGSPTVTAVMTWTPTYYAADGA